VIAKGLHDKFYEKRKSAALDLEKQVITGRMVNLLTALHYLRLVRDCHFNNEQARIDTILDQVTELFANSSHPLHVRNGGLIALAAVGIALGTDVAPYMEKFVKPLLVCFSDTESRIRYFAAESMYNIAKVSRGEILIYFNPIFDALSKVRTSYSRCIDYSTEPCLSYQRIPSCP
jgi:vacuole morphology and inheritance protein 14